MSNFHVWIGSGRNGSTVTFAGLIRGPTSEKS